jgi:hypothetical protein
MPEGIGRPATAQITDSDFTALSNRLANALLDKKEILVTKDGDISITKNAFNPQAVGSTVIGIIHALDCRRLGKSAPLTEKDAAQIQKIHGNTIQAMAVALIKTPQDPGYAESIENALKYFETMMNHSPVIKTKEALHENCLIVEDIMQHGTNKLLSQDCIDVVVSFRDMLFSDIKKFEKNKDFVLPIPEWDALKSLKKPSADDRVNVVHKYLARIDGFLAHQRQISKTILENQGDVSNARNIPLRGTAPKAAFPHEAAHVSVEMPARLMDRPNPELSRTDSFLGFEDSVPAAVQQCSEAGNPYLEEVPDDTFPSLPPVVELMPKSASLSVLDQPDDQPDMAVSNF